LKDYLEFKKNDKKIELKEGEDYVKDEIKLKILNELKNAKLRKGKWFGIIPYMHITFNPSYVEFFGELIDNYGTNKVYSAIKELSDETSGNLKLKENALRREFENREGMSRKKKLTLLTLGLLGATAAFALFNYYYIPLHKKNQRIAQLKKLGLTDEQAYSFDSIFSKYADDKQFSSSYNQTILDFAGYYKINPELAKKVFNIYSEFNNSINFFSFAIDKDKSLRFVEKYPDLIKGKYEIPMELHAKNSTIFDELYRNISLDPNVKDKNELISLASQLFLDLNYTGKVKVLDPKTHKYREEFLKKETIQAFGNYSIAIYQKYLAPYEELGDYHRELYGRIYLLDLPKHDRNTLFLLGNATQINPDIVDFKPVLLRDVDNNTYIVKSNNVPRDIWMITEFLKNRNVLTQPEKYEWINRMIQQLSWEIFDWRDGPNGPLGQRFENKTYKPTDKEVWNVILSFYDYMDELPNKLRQDNIPIAFPYFDSNLLRNYIKDKNNRTIALFRLADLPIAMVDKETGEKVIGLKGMKLFIDQLPKEYEEIVKIYNGERWDYKNGFYRIGYGAWLQDRFIHGLKYTTSQWAGKYLSNIDSPLGKSWQEDIFYEATRKNGRGVSNVIFNEWDAGELALFIYSYERGTGKWRTEAELDAYGIPLAYKAFGIPYGSLGGEPEKLFYPGGPLYGTGGGEWTITLPDNVINSIKQRVSGKIVVGYGNMVGLYSCVDGLERDGVEGVVDGVRTKTDGKVVYIWKKD
ncbi:MAG: hypothetical protein J7K59_02960, partial [Candidatus Korarchaeota archaeon]|nr:hypothetical protein [Candidatus Korarchaeota archaeon]